MKRIKAACLCQTIHFMLKEDLPHEAAVAAVQGEYSHYKELLDRSRIKYKIQREDTLQDGSIRIEVKKQYNRCDIGTYLDE